MKPIRIVLSPTRSRPVNMFLGMVLLLVSLLLFLALATYHASDPSLNTATDSATAHNWVGLFGAYLSDVLLQSLGLTAFLLPLWLGGVGWTWMRSRPGGSPILRWMGTILALVFLPAVFGLLPVALALAAHGSSGRRRRADGGRAAGGLFEHSGRVVGRCCARRLRTLLRVGNQFLGHPRNPRGTLGPDLRSARSLARPPRGARGNARRKRNSARASGISPCHSRSSSPRTARKRNRSRPFAGRTASCRFSRAGAHRSQTRSTRFLLTSARIYRRNR